MKISKKDALMWFRFFAELPEDEPLMPHQQELAWAVISQIETAVDARHKELMAQIPDLLWQVITERMATDSMPASSMA